jgi:adenosylcobinamide-phosphate synthase
MIATVSDHILILLALALDLCLGDPQRLPHPVRLIGRLAQALEASARAHPALPALQVGYASLTLVTLLSGLTAQLLINLPHHLGILAWLYLAYAGLALGQLLREGRAVAALVDSGDLPGARRALALLVSRDVSRLDAEDLRKTLAETLSENLNDGFTAPLFYLVIFGPVGMWASKAVSTLDSMWGYKTPRYRELGQAAALADDVLAFIPARITAGAMVLTSLFLSRPLGLPRKPARALGRIARDAAKMESPNAGWSMAAGAWLCGASMGGRAVYFGRPTMKPVLGPAGAWTPEKLSALMRLMLATGILLAAVLPGVWSLILMASHSVRF